MHVGAEPVAERRLESADGLVALVIALVVLAGGWLVWTPGVAGTFQDDGVYVATARALAEGRGYRLVNLPDAPPQTRYPILYPALLAPVWRLGSSTAERLAAMQGLTLVLGALGVASAALYLVRFGYVRRTSALAGGLLAAACPAVLYFSTQILSEMPFTLALVGAMWAGDRWLRRPARPAAELATGVLVALPFLCRSLGVVVAPVVLALGWMRGRRLRRVALGALATALPWLAWVATQAGAERVDAVLGPQTGYLGWWAWTGMLLDPAVVGLNLQRFAEAFGYLGLPGVAGALYARLDAAGALMTALGVVPWLAVAWRLPRLEALPWVLAAQLAVIAVWPWPPERFLVPLLPLLLPLGCEAFVTGAVRLVAPLAGARIARPAATTAVGLAVTVGLALDVREIGVRHELARRFGYPYLGVPDAPVAWASFEDAFAWLARASRPDDVIASGFDSMTALYTGRPAFRPATLRPRALYRAVDAPLGTAEELRAALLDHDARFLLLSPMPGSPEEEPLRALVAEVLQRWPGLLRAVYRGADPRFLAFEVRPDDGETAPPGGAPRSGDT